VDVGHRWLAVLMTGAKREENGAAWCCVFHRAIGQALPGRTTSLEKSRVGVVPVYWSGFEAGHKMWPTLGG
jgi:hypothetical protein